MPKIREIAETLEGEVEGDGSLNITGVCDLRQGKKNHLAYISDKKYFNVRFQHKPFMFWIWISVILIATGGFFSVIFRKV